jgi:hypothetical protein
VSNAVQTLNEVFSLLTTRRRYEVWFMRLGLADRSGAWWFRYLLMNPGREGCPKISNGMPAQVWVTWFPSHGTPQSFIRGFPLESLDLSARGQNPFHFRVANNAVDERSCRGELEVDGHKLSWILQYNSTFHVTLSDQGWIGFSRTPHSDAVFSGKITLDDQIFEGNPLAFGVQGHNCGYRHRNFWTWTHAHFLRTDGPPSTLEALVYEMPLGLVFRKAVLWHEGAQYVFRNLRETKRDHDALRWDFHASRKDGLELDAAIDGAGPCLHRLPYLKTDCTGSFEVANNSLSKAVLRLQRRGRPVEILDTNTGAVLEMVGC